jgi:hypothetical protein
LDLTSDCIPIEDPIKRKSSCQRIFQFNESN